MKIKKFTVILFWLLLIVPMVHAHYLWLELENYQSKINKKNIIHIAFGHIFPLGDVSNKINLHDAVQPMIGILDRSELDELYTVSPSGKREEILDKEPISIKLKEKGIHWIVAEKKVFLGTCFDKKAGVVHCHIDAPREELEKKGLEVMEYFYAKNFAKTLLKTDGDHGNISKPIGQELEIIPLKDPSTLHKGDFLSLQILLYGRPLAVTYVYATYKGFSPDEETFAYTTWTGEDGIAKIKILKEGVWLIKVHFQKPSPRPEVDIERLCATIVFEVKK